MPDINTNEFRTTEPPSFGAWLRQRRRLLDLTREALGKRISYSPETIKKIEADERLPSIELAQLLARELDIAPHEHAAFVAFARGEAGWSGNHNGSRQTADDGRQTPVVGRPLSTLPAQLTAIIGREREITDIGALLSQTDARLVTLVGPPGTGKTRLCVEIAARLQNAFEDGICFVPLASLQDAAFVLSAIAQALHVREGGSPALLQAVQSYLSTRQTLLVLDNFEHVLTATDIVRDLLEATPRLKILATSREALRLYGEYEYPLHPLPIPDVNDLPELSQLAQMPSVALFVQRAKAIKPDFDLTPANAHDVARICGWLDGLPLAIEMAAVQVKRMTPHRLLVQLSQNLGKLSADQRNLSPRHRTLRTAIEWSYNLLDADEQSLFRHLGVFAGGCSEEAILDLVCAHKRVDERATENLQSKIKNLVDKSLIRHHLTFEDVSRYSMLETLRAFACEQLREQQEWLAAQSRHAQDHLALIESVGEELGKGQEVWSQRLELEHDNFRAALQYWHGQTQTDPQAAHFGLRLAVALGDFWLLRSHYAEGRRWLNDALSQAPDAPVAMRAAALQKLGGLAQNQSDYAASDLALTQSLSLWEQLGVAGQAGQARTLRSQGILLWLQNKFDEAYACYERALPLERALGNSLGVASLLNNIGLIRYRQGDTASALAHYRESLPIARAAGNLRLVANLLNNLGILAQEQGHYAEARTRLDEALVTYRQLGDQHGTAIALNNLANAARPLGDFEAARTYAEESLMTYRRLGNEAQAASPLFMLGAVALRQGQLAAARKYFEESANIRQHFDNQRGLLSNLDGFARVDLAQDHVARAVQLLAASTTLRQALVVARSIPDQVDYEHDVAQAREQLPEAAFAVAWAAGCVMSLTEALALA